jgi:hypothetical protein
VKVALALLALFGVVALYYVLVGSRGKHVVRAPAVPAGTSVVQAGDGPSKNVDASAGVACVRSIADYCRDRPCETLAAARMRWASSCNNLDPLSYLTTGCDGFTMLYVAGSIDSGGTEYFDETTGALVAMEYQVAHSAPDCFAGPSQFQRPSCAEGVNAPCPVVDGGHGGRRRAGSRN